MMVTKLIRILLFLTAALSGPMRAQESPSEPTLGKYVSVTFEIHGLEESAALLKNAALTLDKTMKSLQSGANDLRPEQLDKIASIASATNEVVLSFERTLKEVGPAIDRAREPTKTMLSDVLSAAKVSTIDPALHSLDRSVTKWLVITIVGSLVGLFVVVWSFFSIARQLSAMVGMLQSIAGEYEVVPKRLRDLQKA